MNKAMTVVIEAAVNQVITDVERLVFLASTNWSSQTKTPDQFTCSELYDDAYSNCLASICEAVNQMKEVTNE